MDRSYTTAIKNARAWFSEQADRGDLEYFNSHTFHRWLYETYGIEYIIIPILKIEQLNDFEYEIKGHVDPEKLTMFKLKYG